MSLLRRYYNTVCDFHVLPSFAVAQVYDSMQRRSLMKKAKHYYEFFQFPDALEKYQNALQIKEDSNVLMQIVRVYLRMDEQKVSMRYARAMPYCDRALVVAVAAERNGVLLTKIWMLCNLERFEEAEVLLPQVINPSQFEQSNLERLERVCRKRDRTVS